MTKIKYLVEEDCDYPINTSFTEDLPFDFELEAIQIKFEHPEFYSSIRVNWENTPLNQIHNLICSIMKCDKLTCLKIFSKKRFSQSICFIFPRKVLTLNSANCRICNFCSVTLPRKFWMSISNWPSLHWRNLNILIIQSHGSNIFGLLLIILKWQINPFKLTMEVRSNKSLLFLDLLDSLLSNRF